MLKAFQFSYCNPKQFAKAQALQSLGQVFLSRKESCVSGAEQSQGATSLYGLNEFEGGMVPVVCSEAVRAQSSLAKAC